MELAHCPLLSPGAVIPYQLPLIHFFFPQLALVQLCCPFDYPDLFIVYKVKGFLQISPYSNPIYRSQCLSLWWSREDDIDWEISFSSVTKKKGVNLVVVCTEVL